MSIKEIEFSSVSVDWGIQSRAQFDEAKAQEYAELIKAGIELPPLVVFHDGTVYRLAGGFHRHRGHQISGSTRVLADIRAGGFDDAVEFSIGENQAHGIPRTNADKQRSVRLALNHPTIGKWALRDIAAKCGVSHNMVAQVRKHIASASAQLDDATLNESQVLSSDDSYPQGDKALDLPEPDFSRNDPFAGIDRANRNVQALVVKVGKFQRAQANHADLVEWMQDLARLRDQIEKRFKDRPDWEGPFENIRVLALDRLTLYSDVNVRDDESAIIEYAASLRRGDYFPPCVAFWSGSEFILASGFLRCKAMKRANVSFVTVDVRRGDKSDATLFAIGSNSKHGRRLTERDRRWKLGVFLKEPGLQDMSDEVLARMFGFESEVVEKMRRELSETDVQI
jgi:hypothetical protein